LGARREEKVALDVYFKQDILNVLRATYVANEGPASLVVELLKDRDLCAALDAADVPLEKLLQIYRQGFCTALAAVGLAFGVVPEGRLVGEQRDPSVVRSATGPVSGERLSGGTDTCLGDGADLCDLDLSGLVWARAQWEERQR
jgi:hypothetical protein